MVFLSDRRCGTERGPWAPHGVGSSKVTDQAGREMTRPVGPLRPPRARPPLEPDSIRSIEMPGLCLSNPTRLALEKGRTLWATRANIHASGRFLQFAIVSTATGEYIARPRLIRTPFQCPHDPRLYWSRQGDLRVNFAYFSNWRRSQHVPAIWRQAEAKVVLEGDTISLAEFRPLPIPEGTSQHKNVLPWEDWYLYYPGRQEFRHRSDIERVVSAGPPASVDLRGGSVPIRWSASYLLTAFHSARGLPPKMEYTGHLAVLDAAPPYPLLGSAPIVDIRVREMGIANLSRDSRRRCHFITFPTTVERDSEGGAVVLMGVQDVAAVEMRFNKRTIDRFRRSIVV